ncbi:MAG: VOC family protein [Candidatus Latescibacterota bacterium]|jgi:catechol 2,3-dioxygenase-like lactoylglutathione lyase family enzyme
MLHPVSELTYTILLCDDLEAMKRFYCELFPVEPHGASDTGVTLRLDSTQFVLRKRTRGYDGRGPRLGIPGVQLCFRVAPDEVEGCYQELVARGVRIAEPPTDQARGHRTVYFFDPEDNLLEVYAEIGAQAGQDAATRRSDEPRPAKR